ncbi:hypothetical protein [Clostridium butyricum]|uniref:hypothetical protein n=1 Tax=Clostridium butyricum TaxID=1492 RepID=UPI00071E9F0A|nr:hypothetical protein [Clostridium butyricum]ALS17200.1 hypothetical protein ATD26_10095 [Clostridium butyricum]MDB2158465.1 hypothetical protein [Clostridium butyricum]MDM8130835.1 hypothetical protein [Clostridium butyricum]MDM8229603.1 hypothetical protein [Clostridium butyricum]MDU3583982.1 hypothetical protein [Clostridium butyricum]
MKQNYCNYINDFLLNMVNERMDNLENNDEYKEIERNIESLKNEVRYHLDDKIDIKLNELFELINKKQIISEEYLYKTGFHDGIVFLSNVNCR